MGAETPKVLTVHLPLISYSLLGQLCPFLLCFPSTKWELTSLATNKCL